MLEPWGADSSTSYEPVADDSARVLIEARDALSQGRIADASAAVDSVRRDEVADDVRAGLALIGLLARLARGDVRGAAPYSRELTNLTRNGGRVAAMAWYGLAELAAARAQTDLAISAFERVDEELTAGRDHMWLPWRSGLARMIAGRGETASANALVEKELAEARSSDSPYAVGFALRTLAAVAPTSDRISLLEDALHALSGLGKGLGAARLEAQVRTDLAGWLMLLKPDQKSRSIELLRSAEAYARSEDLGPLLSRVRWLLERLGEHADGELPGRLAELSAAERRVAQLVVVGKRNREIAEELGVSVKSVEWHVSHILRKLSISSRGELADALAQPRQQR
jgi:DNA-binding CsgD family transcriptional regulator